MRVRGRQTSEFVASLVYIVSSRTAMATQRNTVSKIKVEVNVGAWLVAYRSILQDNCHLVTLNCAHLEKISPAWDSLKEGWEESLEYPTAPNNLCNCALTTGGLGVRLP